MNDGPKTLANQKALEDRLRHLEDKAVVALNKYVKRLRKRFQKGKEIPFFDPYDGGENAQCLFLLEAPGPNAVNSGFISRNNPDETAKNLFEISNEIGLSREKSILWNIVPWYIGDGKRIRAASKEDINMGWEHLQEVIKLLPKLSAIVLVGKKAQKIEKRLNDCCPGIPIIKSNHPSPQFINRDKCNRDLVKKQWIEAIKYIKK